jgi:phosphatidylinositol kinase/protein kinase (PI-3  family)
VTISWTPNRRRGKDLALTQGNRDNGERAPSKYTHEITCLILSAQNESINHRYYPGEWGNGRCKQHFHFTPGEVRRETYDVICKNCSPSFRFFFIERFGYSLKDWYVAKTRYSKSVAVSSIVGHILGIGDRHTNNILVSQETGT